MAEDGALGLDAPAMRPMDLDGFKAAGLPQIWTPAEAIARLEAMRAAAPVEHFMMCRPPGLPAERFACYARLFATRVMPALA